MSSRHVVFVIGIGRSGTSALARVLSLCGCTLPRSVLGAEDINPTGLWEPVAAVNMNIEFLWRHGLLNDPRIRLQDVEIEDGERQAFLEQIQSLLSECPAGATLVIKEHRIAELMDFWIEAARRERLSPSVVVAIRHPQEVLASTRAMIRSLRSSSDIATSSDMSVEAFNTSWLRQNLLAERNSRGMPRVFVEYSNLLRDWRTEVARVSRALPLELQADAVAIDGFLVPKLHHQKSSGPITETFGYSWTTRLYAILSAAAQNVAMDVPTLDEIYHAYRSNARSFVGAIDESRDSFDIQRARAFVNNLPVWRAGRDF